MCNALLLLCFWQPILACCSPKFKHSLFGVTLELWVFWLTWWVIFPSEVTRAWDYHTQYLFNRRKISSIVTQIAVGPAFIILLCHCQHLLSWARGCLDPSCSCSMFWETSSFLLPIVCLLHSLFWTGDGWFGFLQFQFSVWPGSAACFFCYWLLHFRNLLALWADNPPKHPTLNPWIQASYEPLPSFAKVLLRSCQPMVDILFVWKPAFLLGSNCHTNCFMITTWYQAGCT